MAFRRRWVLLLLITSAQLLTLLIGVFWVATWLNTGLHEIMRQQVLADSRTIAQQVGTVVETMQLRDLQEGSPDWTRLQRYLETIEIPGGGFVSVVDVTNGKLLCSPRQEVARRPVAAAAGLAVLHSSGEAAPIIELATPRTSASGWAVVGGRVHLLAVQRLQELNAALIVEQPEQNVLGNLTGLVTTARTIGIFTTLALVLFTSLVAGVVFWRYEYRMTRAHEELEQEVQRRTQALLRMRNATIFGLAKLAESRDTDTGEHLDRIRRYVTTLAEELARTNPQLTQEFLENIGLASSLHDIGKVGIPDSILLKRGRLTPAERRIVETHPLIGGRCLEAIQKRLGEDDFLEMARQIALSHHERWDGKGYPARLRGEAIPLAARIVSVADVYDALTSKRPYKNPLSHEEARELILAGRGKQFDPDVVDAFLARESEFQAAAHCLSISDDSFAATPVLVPSTFCDPELEPLAVGV